MAAILSTLFEKIQLPIEISLLQLLYRCGKSGGN